MRIGHFVYSDTLLNVALDRALSKKAEVTTFLYEPYMDASRRNMRIVPVKYRTVDPRNLAQGRVLSRYVEENRFDALLFQLDHWGNILASTSSKGPARFVKLFNPSYPVGRRFRGVRGLLYRFDHLLRLRRVLNSVDAFLVSSEFTKRVFLEKYRGVEGKIYSLPIDNAPVRHKAEPDEKMLAMLPSDMELVLLFGRLVSYKGIDYLIEAEREITRQVPEARIVIAGMGNISPYMKKIEERRDKFIVINRHLTGEEAAALYSRASVVVLPYVDWSTTSGVIPMAYGYGKPVVVSDVGGLPEQVEEGRTGYVVPSRNSHALSERIVDALRNQSMRRMMESWGRSNGSEVWNSLSERYLGVFSEVLARKGHSLRWGPR